MYQIPYHPPSFPQPVLKDFALCLYNNYRKIPLSLFTLYISLSFYHSTLNSDHNTPFSDVNNSPFTSSRSRNSQKLPPHTTEINVFAKKRYYTVHFMDIPVTIKWLPQCECKTKKCYKIIAVTGGVSCSLGAMWIIYSLLFCKRNVCGLYTAKCVHEQNVLNV